MAANLEHFGKDLLVTPFFQADEWDAVDLTLIPSGAVYRDEPIDLATAAGAGNLQQALVLRLLTPMGSMRDLGHAAYGSRLHELIGEANTPATALRARAYVLQAIAQERRVAEVLSLELLPPSTAAPDRLQIHVRVRAAGGGDPIALGLEVAL